MVQSSLQDVFSLGLFIDLFMELSFEFVFFLGAAWILSNVFIQLLSVEQFLNENSGVV